MEVTPMEIAPNAVVSVTYELYIGETNDEEEEDAFDIAEVVGEDEPLVFLHGKSGLPEVFEENLLGLKVGDTFNFWMEAEEGYGEYDPEAKAVFSLAMFQDEEGNLHDGMVEIGNILPFTNDDGSQLNGQIVNIQEENVTVDFNHPLAGKAMHFEGKVIGIRAATPSELDHGHVHGPSGVQY